MLGNGSSTAAEFPVSSQKPCYDFNWKHDVSKQIVCLKVLAWSAGVCIHQQCYKRNVWRFVNVEIRCETI